MGKLKYDPDTHPEAIAKMARLGATRAEIAKELGISRDTLNEWTHTYDAVSDALKINSAHADDRVERTLFERATGVDGLPPDTTACIFWLKNRRPDRWRDRREHEVTGAKGGSLKVDIESARKLPKEQLKQMISDIIAGGASHAKG
jgi:DNA invertase Pin-like site-specific DNA recombinase